MQVALRVSAVGLILTASLLLFDRAGVFIYFGYLPVAVLVAGFAMWASAATTRQPSRSGLLCAPIFTALLVLFAIELPQMRNGPRKSFFLETKLVSVGSDAYAVDSRMKRIGAFKRVRPSGVTTYSVRSSANTVDTLIVHVGSDGRVVSAELSAD